MARVKELYLATTLKELDKHTVIPDVKTKKIHMLLETARKLFLEAEKHYLECDEELAYVFYSKYFSLLESIHRNPAYAEHKVAVRQKLGDNESNKRVMEKLELLSKSLEKRYNRSNDMLLYNNGSVKYDHLGPAELFERVKSDKAKENASTAATNEKTLIQHNSITCKELYDRIRETSVLIMDCRSKNDFEYSRLTYHYAFNVPEEIIEEGMSAGKLQDKLDGVSKKLWSARAIKDRVVLIDWNSRDGNPPAHTPIAILKDILLKWDPDVVYRSPIQILEGGYEYFIMMYPTFSTNPSVQPPQQNNSDINIIDDIEYPSIYDITMKDEIRERSYNANDSNRLANVATTTAANAIRPSVDRSSKRAAIKAYDDKQKTFTEFAKEYKELIEKAQVNDERLEQASKKWHNIFELKRKSADQHDLTAAEQQVLYDFMQLESTAEDYKTENNRLRDELEQYKRQEKVIEYPQEQQLQSEDVGNIEEVIKQIETKIEEREKVDEQHEFEKMEREKQLAVARENKRHMKPPIIEDEQIPYPKIPQFDRSVKPQPAPLIENTMTRKRDFSPVPGTTGLGLTGLKNLGNTCYMNSILQCLSNTPQLTEYCISDKYKAYISRSNKTSGQIVEEVAALIKILWKGTYKCVASKDLRFVIGQYQHIFSGMEQQDSHEFLTILMDLLHSDLQTLQVYEKPRENISASEKAWLQFTKSRESHILRLFYGQIKSTVKCKMCFKESATYESFSNLSLELPANENVCYLSQCMDMYFSGELIHGWNCPTCKVKRDAVKKLDISKLPPVLVVHLKRFYADTDACGNSYKKKQNYVRFPLEDLDMKPYIAKSESRTGTPKTYQLYGVSNHYGSMESGHYTAFCKSGVYNKWFKFDDQVVSPLDKSNVVSSAAYILFYTWLPPVDIKETTN